MAPAGVPDVAVVDADVFVLLLLLFLCCPFCVSVFFSSLCASFPVSVLCLSVLCPSFRLLFQLCLTGCSFLSLQTSLSPPLSVIVFCCQSTVLVTGWEDGTVVAGDVTNWAPAEERSVHKALITTVKWSPDGTRFVTCDKSGVVAVWRLDSRNRPVPVGKPYAHSGAMTHVAFAGTVVPEAGEGADDLPPPKVTSFFFGGAAGVVYYADDVGNCAEAAKVGAFFLRSTLLSLPFLA